MTIVMAPWLNPKSPGSAKGLQNGISERNTPTSHEAHEDAGSRTVHKA
ncbi:hypothetical protein [Rhodomicrobium lacus]|nr:hypothetical protein [Rhodomicrobium lacus]